MVSRIKIWLAFWIWRNLAGGRVPFYASFKLRRHQTYTPPLDGNRLRLQLWTIAVNYLVNQGKLTQTPTLQEKF